MKAITSTRAPRSNPHGFQLVAVDQVEGLEFSTRIGGRRSHYDDALQKLKAAENGTVLMFDSLKALNSVKAAAKRQGVAVEFAQQGEKLAVRLTLNSKGRTTKLTQVLAGTHTDELSMSTAEGKLTVGDMALAALKQGSATFTELQERIENRFQVTPNQLTLKSALQTLRQANKVIPPPHGSGDAWRVAA